MTAKTVSITFYDDFQLVVKSILIPSYEGAQRAASKLIVICAFGLNKLIKFILASGNQPNSKYPLSLEKNAEHFMRENGSDSLATMASSITMT
jgi:hypothetical protein